MKNFGSLYKFELKKLWGKRMTWVTLLIMLAVIITGNLSQMLITSLTDEEIEISAYEDIVKRREYALALSGRPIDDMLLGEMQKAYGDSQIVFYEELAGETGGGLSEGGVREVEIQVEDGRSEEQIAEDHRKYDGIYSFAASICDYDKVLTVDAQTLYQIRQEGIIEEWVKGYSLSEMEEKLWIEREERIEKPFIYEYGMGFVMLFGQINTLDYLWILLCAICLSGFFADEHLRRTDQVILCSRYGKEPVYFAKMAAGISFALGGTILFYVTGALLALGIYGTDGFHAALQLYVYMSSWDISIGESVCILFLVSLCGVLACSVLTMILSEILRNATAVLSLVSGVTFLSLFVNVPPESGVLSRLYALLPTKLLHEWGFIDNRMVHVAGKYFHLLQTAPVVYLALAAGLGWIGYEVYKRYQVRGR
ncbi:MAG: hypothetical protein NC314_03305 [Roseburia sp.]|nr:hypothetical protein [Roseburia sp.]MCM1241841.1 hypothetical protein [Roseburia sp.]